MASHEAPTPSGSRSVSGRYIGHFVIDKEIGKGSFAQVYMGWQKDSKAAVAIKSVELARLNKKLIEKLYGEIQILKSLRHSHIVALHDCVKSATHINLIMEYCELGDLSLFIKKRDKLVTHPATHDMARKYPVYPNSGLHEVVIRHFLKQLASALEFLRSKNYMHRDVKPQNLLLLPSQSFRDQRAFHVMSASQDSLTPVAGLTSLPMLKLADFGFARVLPSTSLADTLCGSPLYMAPEILRYERYDAKADLWSVGTVLYEMTTGRPPFRARNHVELLRKIEVAEDVIRFPREVAVTPELKTLVRALLKRSPVERLSFDSFFTHPIVTDGIPGLVEDDVPQSHAISYPRGKVEASSTTQKLRRRGEVDAAADMTNPAVLRSTKLRNHPSPTSIATERGAHPRLPIKAQSPTCDSPGRDGEGLGIRRPSPQHALSTPNYRAQIASAALRDDGAVHRQHLDATGVETIVATTGPEAAPGKRHQQDEEKAVQEVMFERDYVVVERRHVEVNALADELAANDRLSARLPSKSRAAQMVRRSTQQGNPTSVTGAVPTPVSQTALVAQGRRPSQERRGSYERPLSASPGSTSSAITKAIQDASLRLLGFKVAAPLRGVNAHSPPTYQPFPAYPTPPTSTATGLLCDGKGSQTLDEDVRAKDAMEAYAERSDCVYGFAEVKYKQLVPMAPSIDHGLGGLSPEQLAKKENELTVEATASLSEEALVLYVKSLTLLARAMDIASIWWAKKGRATSAGGISMAASPDHVVQKINAVVQWVRQRFNEVLEKSDIVRLKLLKAQKQLPDEYRYQNSSPDGSAAVKSAPAVNDVRLTPGLSAEKLMYDRALDMSRAAAIDEVTNENLPGCKISYMTAIRMLEAVLESESDSSAGKQPLGKGRPRTSSVEPDTELDVEEEVHVRKIIKMITGRLASVTKKQRMIDEANSKTTQSAR